PMLERMSEGIPLRLDYDYLLNRTTLRAARLLVFTGPIDEYFNNCLGRLTYRGQMRETRYVRDRDWLMPCVQINEPGPECPTIRTIEWKHMMRSEDARRIRGTVITSETPFTPTDSDGYEYPFPDNHNRTLYRQYRALAERESGVLFCGRLGEYRYYDMDQAIARALKLAHRISKGMMNEPVVQSI
ncbi:MAG: UDP-galactopyranose mutase, partial [Planctomycetes bacterium]|nr:UDP-galactopyranose mutase [Planctomycetota bacterium]